MRRARRFWFKEHIRLLREQSTVLKSSFEASITMGTGALENTGMQNKDRERSAYVIPIGSIIHATTHRWL